MIRSNQEIIALLVENKEVADAAAEFYAVADKHGFSSLYALESFYRLSSLIKQTMKEVKMSEEQNQQSGEQHPHESRLAPHIEAYRAEENHVFRQKYRQLSDFEARVMEEAKARAYFLYAHLMAHVPASRERALAITKLEESIMWAVKAITA